MKAAIAALLALLLLAPGARGQPAAPEYPEDLRALLDGWMRDAEALGAPSKGKPWYPDVETWLAKARQAQADGRVRVAMFDIETYTELVLAHELVEDANETGSDAEGRALVVARTREWQQQAEAEWTELRAAARELDADARSLHTIEQATYGADIGLMGMLLTQQMDLLARDLGSRTQIDVGYVAAMVRASHTALLDATWGRDIIESAGALEGLPPRVLDDRWANLSLAARYGPSPAPPYLEPYEKRAEGPRANNESIVSLAFALAEQRAARENAIQGIFGDARSRGKAVVADAARGMGKTLNNTTMETARAVGLRGVFTADAIDRASYTQEVVASGNAELANVVVAWSGLDHAGYVVETLGAVSPVEPVVASPTKPTPGASLALAGLALLAAALLARRR